jgi:hypothetical protein
MVTGTQEKKPQGTKSQMEGISEICGMVNHQTPYGPSFS